jgi:hypothetical protein
MLAVSFLAPRSVIVAVLSELLGIIEGEDEADTNGISGAVKLSGISRLFRTVRTTASLDASSFVSSGQVISLGDNGAAGVIGGT